MKLTVFGIIIDPDSLKVSFFYIKTFDIVLEKPVEWYLLLHIGEFIVNPLLYELVVPE